MLNKYVYFVNFRAIHNKWQERQKLKKCAKKKENKKIGCSVNYAIFFITYYVMLKMFSFLTYRPSFINDFYSPFMFWYFTYVVSIQITEWHRGRVSSGIQLKKEKIPEFTVFCSKTIPVILVHTVKNYIMINRWNPYKETNRGVIILQFRLPVFTFYI